MKRVANFIVSKRYWILGVMLCFTVLCAVLSQQVSVNTDMTKYLPDDSAMRIGMDIMEDEFPEMETSSGIRVMADGLNTEQKRELLEKLESLPYVDSVAHDDTEDYNKDNYSLFEISTSYDYGSDEELSIEAALDSDFSEYNIIWQNSDDTYEGISPVLLITAVSILMIILFVMSESWFEPLLFLLTIGFAVVINSGTNIFLGEISNITSSITAILQLVLSMDYSIILINRYRQEKGTGLANQEAMAAAVQHAFGSVASSAMTTVVGLLALAFMNFKIGMDLGIVLAKGVFISMVCVITILPCLILLCDKIITKTAKKAIHIPMGRVARFSYRFRYVMLAVFLLAFFGFNHLQGNTQIAYTLESADPIGEVFPANNMLVMVYDNNDEEKVAQLAESLENRDGVKQVLGYPNLLGKPYTAQELGDSIGELGDSLGADMGDAAELDPALLNLIYYHYYDGQTEPLTMGQFLQFLSEDVLTNDTFADAIDEDMRKQADTLAKFSDPDELTSPKSIQELADFFDMDTETVKNLLLYYYTQYGGIDTGVMTLPTFASFVVDEVANNPDYSSLFDKDTLSKLDQLKTFTDVSAVTAPASYSSIANILGMDADTTKLLFVYYYAMSDSYNPGTMTLPAFVNFLQNDVMNNPTFASSLDESTKAQINTLSQFTDKRTLQAQRTPAELAAMFGMDESMVKTIFVLHNAGDVSGKTMTLSQFTGFLNDDILNNPLFAGSFDDETKGQLQYMNGLIQCAASGKALTPSEMAGMLGMDEAAMAQLYFLYLSTNDTAFGLEVAKTTMSLPDFLPLVKAQASDEQMAQLAASGTALDAATLSSIFGMEESQVQQLFGLTLAAQKTITLPAFTDFLVNKVLTDEAYAGNFDDATKSQMTTLNQMVQLAAAGSGLDAATLAKTFGMEESMITLVFRLYYGGDVSGKTMSMEQLVDFILSDFAGDPVLGSYLDSGTISQLQMMQKLIKATVNGTSFTYKELAETLGMDGSMLKMLFTYHDAQTGVASSWRLSLRTVINFLLNNSDTFSSMMGADAVSQLSMAQQMIEGSVNGTAYSPEKLAGLIGMDSAQLKQLYLLYFSEHGDTSTWRLPVQTLVNFLNSDVLTNSDYADLLDQDTQTLLTGAKVMIDAVVAGKEYTAAETFRILSALTDELDENTVELLYFYYASQENADPAWTLSIDQLFHHLCNSVLEDPRFEAFIDADMRSQLTDVQETLEEGIDMLKSGSYSRMILSTTFPAESEETTEFLDELNELRADFEGDYYLIGNSAMTYEMQQTFNDELNLITMLTSIAIFLIVMISFRSLIIPLLLVLLVQCSVYITVTVVGIQGYSIYFLALLIVECILMGATIDYGILFTNYYRENRKILNVKQALGAAYQGSIHTIMTSGLIIVLVTGILGYTTADPTIGQIARTISTGALCAILMILFVLPGMLAAFDKFIIRTKKENVNE